jgi:diguanylate cyclase (GGDEF)-like protein
MADYDYQVASATRTLALLQSQAENQRLELAKLRKEVTLAQGELARERRELSKVQTELAQAQRNLTSVERDWSNLQQELRGGYQAQLREANEQLVIATLTAESLAETAKGNLNEMVRVSQRDPLTNTPNRTLMLDRIENSIALARRYATRIAVLFIDVDNFKQINDTLGHAMGDVALQLVAQRLEGVVRNTDTVSRHSGDEFLVLLAEVGQVQDVIAIAEKMLGAIHETVHSHQQLTISISIGIAIFPEDGIDPAGLISCADAAMYRAKKRGGNCYEVEEFNLPD